MHGEIAYFRLRKKSFGGVLGLYQNRGKHGKEKKDPLSRLFLRKWQRLKKCVDPTRILFLFPISPLYQTLSTTSLAPLSFFATPAVPNTALTPKPFAVLCGKKVESPWQLRFVAATILLVCALLFESLR